MIGILLITHGSIGEALLGATATTFGKLPLPTCALPISRQDCPEEKLKQARAALANLDKGNGVLVLTDIYGSTPSNIAHALAHEHHVQIVTGVNLPMIFRVMNYAHLDLTQITQKALSGGKDGILAREIAVGESL